MSAKREIRRNLDQNIVVSRTNCCNAVIFVVEQNSWPRLMRSVTELFVLFHADLLRSRCNKCIKKFRNRRIEKQAQGLYQEIQKAEDSRAEARDVSTHAEIQETKS